MIPKQLSYSQFSLYNTCPRQYKSRYIDKIKPPGTIHTLYGSAAHSLMEKMYRDCNFDLQKWLIEWPEVFKVECLSNKKVVLTEDDREKLISKGYKHIPAVFNWLQSQQLLQKPLSVEIQAVGQYQNHKCIYLIDLVLDNGIDHILVDYKFGKIISEDHKYQLVLYAAFYAKATGIKNLKGVLIYPDKIKESKYVLFTENFRSQAGDYFNTIYKNLINDTKFEPKKNKYCSSCSIRFDCPLFENYYVQD